MQKFGLKSQKLNEILIFEKLTKLRYCLNWTHENLVTRPIFKVEVSSFGFGLIFVCSKVYILQLKLSDQFFNYLIFMPPPKGG